MLKLNKDFSYFKRNVLKILVIVKDNILIRADDQSQHR